MRSSAILVIVSLCAFAASSFAVDFKKDVQPIFRTNCYKCHGKDKKGKLRMDILEQFGERIGKGTFKEDKFVIIPGKPDESEMIIKLSRPYEDEDRMPPPRRGDPLNSSQIAILKAWIQAGASFEEGSSTPTPATADMPDKTALQSWVSTSGKTIKAYFVRAEGDKVVLKSETGQEKTFPISLFSEDSKALIKKLSE